MKRYPRQLSAGENNIVIALNQLEVAKIYEGDTRSDIGSEAEKLQFANSINGLVAKFIRIDFDEEKQWEMLVMKRLFPMDFRSMEFERRELIFNVFEDELAQLHKAGFAHRDICRPSIMAGESYDNIFLTASGLRLIDVGISTLQRQVGGPIFERFVEQELKEISEFKEFFLNR